MANITEPMLAAKFKDQKWDIKLPVLATPKWDGIRCLKLDGKALSRKFLPIPNDHIRTTIENAVPDGCDGEIMIPGMTFNELSGAVRRKTGKPNFIYVVFDFVLPTDVTGTAVSYETRMKMLETLALPSFCQKCLPIPIGDEKQLLEYEQKCLAEGFEGVMIRWPYGPYKCGRATLKEGYLTKLKRFEDSEAIIVGYEEEMENFNPKERDEFGNSKRSTHQENMVPKGRLGKLICKGTQWSEEFGIGTGFDANLRLTLWVKRFRLKNKIVKFKHQASGAKDRPRFPVFLGFRDEWDM